MDNIEWKNMMERSMKRAVFLGDSITMGYALKNAADRFSTKFCETAHYCEVNYGICGTLIARAANLQGAPYVDRCETMQDGDLIVVFGGTNDYFWTLEPITSPGPNDDRYFDCAVRQLCRKLKAKYAGKQIVFILPYKMRGVGRFWHGPEPCSTSFHTSDEKNFLGHTLAEYVDIQREICTQEHIPFLDLFHDPEIDIAHNEADFRHYTIDGCHPNENGHCRIAEKLFNMIVKLQVRHRDKL